ncbi:hypothetical protein HMPREF1008_01609 [Olsenella sp. oral taxon 809 str. F0356]|uniref:hypothetical protein n=1 Tax=Olsenella sp. oral taxon 809 TaxID=661086 RepID=UPI000231F351|nr:hypothetical protein [Olsenella sp. oral taxon 809]EHF01464.1 hypothetical protein HMPREF1008_01609 [Olsenella sp. oral taxon 809 str. F0356]
MKASEAAKAWGWSEDKVRRYCRDGMVPFASKELGRFGREEWVIPNGSAVPPISLYDAANWMTLIRDVSEGAAPDLQGPEGSDVRIADALAYLGQLGWCTRLELRKDARGRLLPLETVRGISLTTSGLRCLDEFNDSRKRSVTVVRSGALTKSAAGLLGLSMKGEVQETRSVYRG